MMTTLKVLRGKTMKAGDTHPALRVKAMEDGEPFNLSGYDVDIHIADEEGNTVADTTVTSEQPSRGIVEYDWSNGDTDTAGVYQVELVAQDGTDEVTFPNRGTVNLNIEPRLL